MSPATPETIVVHGDGPRIVAVGGGHGLSRTLLALRRLPVATTAVVTVADDGGSSGRLRREHGIIALGDMRMALSALASRQDLAALMGHRFSDGGLRGHALGNLALLALVERHAGDVEAALDDAAALLGCRGEVWPCTTEEVTLLAEVDGAPVEGQVAVATTEGRRRAVWLAPPDPAPSRRAVEALRRADVVVLGPGSLYTSIIPNLLVPGIAEAAVDGGSRLLYVANLTGQAGETGGMDAQDHVDALLAHLPPGVGLEVLRHEGPSPTGTLPPLDGPIGGAGVVRVHHADLVEDAPGGGRGGAHDPLRLASALAAVVGVAAPDGLDRAGR